MDVTKKKTFIDPLRAPTTTMMMMMKAVAMTVVAWGSGVLFFIIHIYNLAGGCFRFLNMSVRVYVFGTQWIRERGSIIWGVLEKVRQDPEFMYLYMLYLT